jgi:hypothetical protein
MIKHGTRSMLALLCLLVMGSPAQGERIKLGLVLTNPLPEWHYRNKNLDTQILNAAIQAFHSTRRFDIAEREKLETLFAEKSLSEMITGEDTDLRTMLDLDLLGMVNYTVETEVDSQNSRYETYWIEVQLTDVETGRVIELLSSRRATLAAGLADPTSPTIAAQRLYANIRDTFPPEGEIIKISGSKIYVDLGTDLGIKPGDTLEILRPGESIIHPRTGELLPGEEVLVGVLKVATATEQLATCKAKKVDSPPELLDLVRFKPANQEAGKVLQWMGNFKSRSLRALKGEKKDY